MEKTNRYLKEFLETTIYSESSDKLLVGSSNEKSEEKMTVGAKPATGSHKQNHIFSNIRGPHVSDDLKTPPRLGL